MALSSAKINEIKKKFTKKKLKPILQLALSLLPAALLIMVMMSGYFVELFSLRGIRHEQEVEPSNYNSSLFSNIFNGIRPEFDATGYFENLLDQFTSGLTDPDNILFQVSPANPIAFWRYESFDYYGYQTTTRTSEWTNSPSTLRQMGSSSRPIQEPGVTTYTVTMDISHAGNYFSFVPTAWSSRHGAYIDSSTVRINGSRIDELPSWTGIEILEDYIVDSDPLDDIVDCRGVQMRLTFNADTPHNSTLTYEVGYLADDTNELNTYSMGIADYSASFIQDWDQIDTLYRQYPDEFNTPSGVGDYRAWAPTTSDLANQLLDYPDNVAAQAFNVMFYLATNFEFDLQMWVGEYLIGQTPHPSPDQDYVEWFIADYKKGVSAHFASALAMILRLQNIPARIVTGWAVGNQTDPAVDRRDITAVYTHSWVEALVPLDLPGIGPTARWIIFDADPRAGLFYDLPIDVVGGDTPTLNISDTFSGSREIFPGESVTFSTLLRDASGLPIEGADIDFYLRGTDFGSDILLDTVQTNSNGIANHLFVYDIVQHTSGLQVQISANTTVNIGGGDVPLEALSEPFDLRLNHASAVKQKQSSSRNDPLLAFPKIFVYDCISASIFDIFKPLCIVFPPFSVYNSLKNSFLLLASK